MKCVVIFLFTIFATSLVGGCSAPMIQRANMACKVIYGITKLLGSKDDSDKNYYNTDSDLDYTLKESERYESITR